MSQNLSLSLSLSLGLEQNLWLVPKWGTKQILFYFFENIRFGDFLFLTF